MQYSHEVQDKPGTDSRWVDIAKGHPRKRNGYPIEIIDALNHARDSGVPAALVVELLRKAVLSGERMYE